MRILLLSLLTLFISTTGYSEPTLLIVAHRKPFVPESRPWDPDSIKSGIGGSEEAVIYVSQKLADLGYRVTVACNLLPGSPYSHPDANPRFVNLDSYDGTIYDVGIAWRAQWHGDWLKKRARTVFLFPQDLLYDYEQEWFTDEQVNCFDDVLWITQWQRDQWVSMRPSFAKFTKIFGNAVNPEQFGPVKERSNPYSCIYGSSYDRGLEVLLDIWPFVKAKYPRATLDIYYGFPKDGIARQEKIKDQLAALQAYDVREHGRVGQEELTRAYEAASLWTYPCLALETFCISALRAQLAGCIPVIINGSALQEVVRSGYKCEQVHEYLKTLLHAMANAENITLEERKKGGEFVLNEYTWARMAQRWKELFDATMTRSCREALGVAPQALEDHPTEKLATCPGFAPP